MIQSPRHPLPLVVAGVALCVAGCGSAAEQVDNFPVTTAGEQACADLLESLPEQVSDLDRTRVEGSTFGAAWGDEDRIVLRCGVTMPPDFTQISECNVANGIGWYVPPTQADNQSSDLTMTTVHREPAVSVFVPAQLRPPAAAMVDLARTLKAHTEATGSCR